jgi:predicted peptidase
MIIQTIAILLLSLLQPSSTMDTKPIDNRPAVQVINRSMELDGQLYKWSIMIPDSAQRGGASLLFLHGAGECGTDGKKNLAVGLPPAVMKNPETWPFVLIVPQKPSMLSEWEDHERALLAMLKEAHKDGFIDSDRLAITGLSQGGHGTITLASMHPERFRAAVPVCGYVERRVSRAGERLEEIPANPDDPAVIEAAKKLAKLPVWFFHGDLDNVVPSAESSALNEALQQRNADTRYTELADTNHNAWDPAYSNEQLAAWLIKHTKAE